VTVSLAKISVNTSNIERAENNQWDAVNVEPINLVLRTLKKLNDDIKECAYNDTVLPASKAPSWTLIHFNHDEQDCRKVRALIDGNANGSTITSNCTNTTTNSPIMPTSRVEHPRNEHFYMMTYGYKNCS
jgi:hypothetical protein